MWTVYVLGKFSRRLCREMTARAQKHDPLFQARVRSLWWLLLPWHRVDPSRAVLRLDVSQVFAQWSNQVFAGSVGTDSQVYVIRVLVDPQSLTDEVFSDLAERCLTELRRLAPALPDDLT
jgi:hypothetical protein